MLDLTPDEARWLRQMADDIAASTQDRAYWLSTVRETSLALLSQLAEWLGDACEQSPPEPQRRHRLPCVRPTHHDGPHLDPSGHSWDHP
ncbi:hypothetical protein [Allosalinactinospora lopnorensis]|uniref:hypothetical protein n=1 Tax=Allosalinactinospora lopnorensis TaxID=1352348 RepID=UPI000623CB4A|nr:hypothetical protein [Allosalinactinospora lopnorensis]